VSPEDRALIEEFARARPSSPVPAMGFVPAVERLIALGVMTAPSPAADLGTVGKAAQRACRDYLGGEWGAGL
jgi:hypothetical protein